MKFLSKKQLREKVLYCPAHIARLEGAGKFAKRVSLGPRRVGRLKGEIEEWRRARIAERTNTTAPHKGAPGQGSVSRPGPIFSERRNRLGSPKDC
jgi:prophage regulatory protein